MTQISLASFANFNSAVPWGLWVAIYIWLVGISAGTFCLISWGNLKQNPHLKKITRLGIILSLATLLLGLLSILIDLGRMERFYQLFISPQFGSAMAWMVWIYNFFFVILLTALFRFQKSRLNLFFKFGMVFSLVILVVESLLFALPPGKYWHSPIFILHFITSSFAVAIMALIFATAALWAKREEKTELLKGLSRIALPLLAINLVVELAEIFLHQHLFHLESWFSLAGSLTAILLLLKFNPKKAPAAASIGLLAILLSKYNSVVLAQVIEPFKGFARAYIEPRLNYSYAPSLFEVLAAAGLLVGAAIVLYFFYKIFPLTKEA